MKDIAFPSFDLFKLKFSGSISLKYLCFDFFFSFLVKLFKLKTYHEVVDEIYYQVKHLEPWERGSRKTAGQTGMCGGVGNVLHINTSIFFIFCGTVAYVLCK